MKAILKTNTIITQKNKKPHVRTYLSIKGCGGFVVHIYIITQKKALAVAKLTSL